MKVIAEGKGVKRIALLFAAVSILVFFGCGRYIIPMEGKLDRSTESGFTPISSPFPNIAVYLDKEISKTIIVKKAEGASCGHASSEVPVGPALNNALVKALRLSFPHMKLVETPERASNFALLKISLAKLDVGFEYSAMAGCEKPRMDKGRVSGTLITEVVNPEGKTIFKESYSFEESGVDHDMPPATQAAVLEKCLNTVVYNYIRAIKKPFQI